MEAVIEEIIICWTKYSVKAKLDKILQLQREIEKIGSTLSEVREIRNILDILNAIGSNSSAITGLQTIRTFFQNQLEVLATYIGEYESKFEAEISVEYSSPKERKELIKLCRSVIDESIDPDKVSTLSERARSIILGYRENTVKILYSEISKIIFTINCCCNNLQVQNDLLRNRAQMLHKSEFTKLASY